MSFKHWTTRDNSNISGAGPGAGSDADAAAGPLKWAEILELAPESRAVRLGIIFKKSNPLYAYEP